MSRKPLIVPGLAHFFQKFEYLPPLTANSKQKPKQKPKQNPKQKQPKQKQKQPKQKQPKQKQPNSKQSKHPTPTPIRNSPPAPIRNNFPTPIRNNFPTPARNSFPTPIRNNFSTPSFPAPIRDSPPTPIRNNFLPPTPIRNSFPTMPSQNSISQPSKPQSHEFKESEPKESEPKESKPKESESKPPKRQQLTHFLSLPLYHATGLRESLQAFAMELRARKEMGTEGGIPEKALRSFRTIHLTLGVMSLPTDADLARAVDVFKACDFRRFLSSAQPSESSSSDTESGGVPLPRHLRPTIQPLTLTLRSLQSMSRPSKCSVLYATPQDDSGRLFPFCESVRDYFVEKNVVLPNNSPLKLHATILNTAYARKNGKRGGKKGGWLNIDATMIIEREQERVWAENVTVGSVQICRMEEEKDTNGESLGYKCVIGKSILG